MITSIRRLLEEHQIQDKDSVYGSVSVKVLDYPVTIGDFVEPCVGERAFLQFACLKAGRDMEESWLRGWKEYVVCISRIEEINRVLKADKRKKNVDSVVGLSLEEKNALKIEKKQWKMQERRWRALAEQECLRRLGYLWKSQMVFRYKNTVYLSEMADMKKCLPVLEGLNLPEADRMPFFVSHLDMLSAAMEQGADLGIVGGPCLFGKDEVFLCVRLKNGEMVRFDCCNGRRCLNEAKTDATLEEFILENRQQIEAVDIDNQKTGITRQEYDSISYLFAFASVLHAKAVIPLPDISYVKYIRSDLAGLDEECRENVLQCFQEECSRIADMYLSFIEKMGRIYPDVEFQVLHARNEELCRLFYCSRKPYVKNSSYIAKLTNRNGKKDAVIDYITMMALPYYVYGTRQIVQLDSVDEVDSGRKCVKIHKREIQITQILYPEYLSRDGKHTIYNAQRSYKDYVEGAL